MFDYDDNLDVEIKQEALTDFLTGQLERAVFLIEATGSFTATKELGLFDRIEMPADVIETIRVLAPVSRGGLAKGVGAEARWEALVDDTLKGDGLERLEKVREILNGVLPDKDKESD